MRSREGLAVLWVFLLNACGGGGDFTITGRIAAGSASKPTGAEPGRRVTHILAVDPETAAPRRSLTTVGEDGSFHLTVESGHPYVLVLVDSKAVGPDMVVALFRAGTLDTLSPQLAGHLELGDVKVDARTGAATAGIAYGALLEALGLSASAAEALGAVDDLSLRYANPDIDGDGTIDLEQDHAFTLDLHVRASLRRGPAGAPFTVADLTDRFLPLSGPDVATPVFNLASIYVEYPAGFDATAYVGGGPPGALTAGAGYEATATSGGPASFSALAFGDARGWGPDYDLARGAELPGSGGAPATLVYTLGRSGKRLTFSNVVTRTAAALTAPGSLAIFIKLDTAAGLIAGVEYAWMTRGPDGSWTPATAEEIALTIGSDGGHLSFHRVPSWRDEVGLAVPARPSGLLSWPASPTRPQDLCGLAVSYDDKLGLRRFVGGVDPDPGVTCTP